MKTIETRTSRQFDGSSVTYTVVVITCERCGEKTTVVPPSTTKAGWVERDGKHYGPRCAKKGAVQ